MLCYRTSTVVKVFVIFVTVGSGFVDFMKVGYGQLQRKVFVTPNVALTVIKCTVLSTFPRIHQIKLISRSQSWLRCLDMSIPNNIGVHHRSFFASSW